MRCPEIFWYVTELLKASTPLLIGGFAAWIALRQWRTSHHKLKLDLFDRRIRVYIATVRVLTSMSPITGLISDKTYFNFVRAVGEAEFMFPQSAVEFLSEILKLARRYRSIERQMKRAQRQRDDEKITVLDNEQGQVEADAEGIYKQVTGHFRPYLDFRDIR